MWENRFQCNEFTDKKVSTDKLNSICDIIPNIPEPPPGAGHSRVLWFLLDKSNEDHRKVTEYLIDNFHNMYQDEDDRNPDKLPIHFGQLLQAPYLLHGTILRIGKRFPRFSQFSNDFSIIKERANIQTSAKMSVLDLKQYVNLSIHAGSILAQIVSLDLNCCIIGCLKGRFMNFPKLITNDDERKFTDLIIKTFPQVIENPSQVYNPNDPLSLQFPQKSDTPVGIHTCDTLCPGISIAFGYGIKHDDSDKLLSDDKYIWPAYKDRKKYPNLYK